MSGRKNVLIPFSIITSGDMSGDLTSTVSNIQYMDNIGIQLVWTGTPTGDFTVDVSVDQVTWTSLTLSPSPAATGAADNIYIDVNQISAPYIRVTYTATSGSGTLNAKITGKMI